MNYKIYRKEDVKNFCFTEEHFLLTGVYVICFNDSFMRPLSDCTINTIQEALKDDGYVFIKVN